MFNTEIEQVAYYHCKKSILWTAPSLYIFSTYYFLSTGEQGHKGDSARIKGNKK